MKDYHKDFEFLSKSFLTKFQLSPLHAYHYMTAEQTDTDAMRFGRAYHAIIADQMDEVVIFDPVERPEPDKNFGSKLNKQWKEEIFSIPDKDIISMEEYLIIKKMIAQLQLNEMVQQIHAFELVQEEAFRTVIDTYKVKCKPDGLQIGRGENKENLIIDWKTCTSVHPDKIRYDIVKYGYDVQAALYSDIITEIHGNESNFMFIFQEKTEPYDVLPVIIPSESEVMYDGRNKWRNYAIQARKCFDSGVWPGVAGGFMNNCLIIE